MLSSSSSASASESSTPESFSLLRLTSRRLDGEVCGCMSALSTLASPARCKTSWRFGVKVWGPMSVIVAL